VSNALLGLALLNSGIQFTKVYLNLPEYAVRLNRILGWVQISILVLPALGFTFLVLDMEPLYGKLFGVGFVLIILMICLCYYAAYIGVKNNHVTARYYLIATSLFFVVSIVMILSISYLIPLQFNWKILQWSSVIEMLIFSFGLSRQIKLLELDKQKVTTELLHAKEDMIDQLETINKLKDQVLSKSMDSKLYPEFARIFPIINKITYIQALGNSSRVVYSEEGIENEIEIQGSLKDIETCFDNNQFIRIHRTYLIRQGIKYELVRRTSADYDLTFHKVVLPVGRKFAKMLKQKTW
jgi:uncharacterized membrane protein YciS (DUF1049 family)